MTGGARCEHDALPRTIRERINGVFARLEKWPMVSGAKALRGNLAGHHRIRTGDYRVQFTVNSRGEPVVVTVVKVGRRDGFYDS